MMVFMKVIFNEYNNNFLKDPQKYINSKYQKDKIQFIKSKNYKPY